MISFQCDNCGHPFEVDRKHAGKKARCKHCLFEFTVPVPRTPKYGSASGERAAIRSEDRSGTVRAASAPARGSASSNSASAKKVEPADFDPFGLDEIHGLADSSKSDPYDAEFDELPIYPKPNNAKRPKSTSNSFSSRDPTITYASILGIWAVFAGLHLAGLISFLSFVVVSVTLQLGLAFVGGIGLLVSAFRESGWTGLKMFLPFYSLYYMYSRWDVCQPWGSMVCTYLLISFFFNVLVGAGLIQSPRAKTEKFANEPLVNAGPAANLGQPATNFELPRPGERFEQPIFRGPRAGGIAGVPRINPVPGGPVAGIPIGPPGGIPAPPSDAVVIEVSGLADQETREVFQTKFEKLQKEFARGSNLIWSLVGDKLTYQIWPLDDVQAFANRIDFAKVVRVDAKSLALQANPLTDAERRPEAGPGREMEGVLFDLKSGVVNRQKDGLRVLQRMPPNDRREEVARALESLLFTSDIFVKDDAAKLLGDWGSKENTRALVNALHNEQGGVKRSALESLGRIKDPSCAEAVAFLLNDGGARDLASQTLKALGTDAEPAVLKLLDSRDVFARTEACKILKVIGTDACIAPLQELFRRVNGFGFDADAAKEALLEHNASISPQGRGTRKKGRR